MAGPSTIRLVGVAILVVGVAVGAVVLLLPSVRAGTVSVDRPDASELLEPGNARAVVGRAAWVVAENRKPGTTDWHITGPINNNNIEGYADTTSAVQGQRVRLYVSTDAPTYRVEAYRIGWYGGAQARLVWRSQTLPGVRQAPAQVAYQTNMVEAPWSPSLTVTPDRSWPPGNYLLKLVGSNGFAQYVPLTVRDDSSKAALVVLNAVTTWQAYNRWGGHSLYEGFDGYGGFSGAGRAVVVSFDRPYENDSGAGDYLGNEVPMVSFLEKEGFDVTYWTDVDLHHRGDRLNDHRALLTLGHDEYWTLEMRDAVERARDRGLNVAFFGANAVYRAIRLEPSSLGPSRRQVNYRSTRDPLYGIDNSRVTVSWREPPLNRPESTLVGNYYECNPVEADMVITDPSAWVFAGTNVVAGERIPRLIGPEYDRYNPAAPQPPGPVRVLAHSPLRCGGKASFSDMTYYSTPSGAGVFATGTNWWISRLGPPCPPPDICHDERVVRVTRNVVEAFAAGPAGLEHPSASSSDARAPNGGLPPAMTTTLPPPRAASTTTTVPRRTTTTRRPVTVTTTTTTVPMDASPFGPPVTFPWP
ncbi:MAG TPA: N,N-dimethylformamidase beta subunit family domain-containing protein [Acidimicrobiales bacterium]|nr:N,N-dimethylformamidase beta subunit family domain-containing protein [Acidimicrobiales bacterium]